MNDENNDITPEQDAIESKQPQVSSLRMILVEHDRNFRTLFEAVDTLRLEVVRLSMNAAMNDQEQEKANDD